MCSIWLLISGILYATTRISSRSTGPPDPYMFKSPNPKYMVGEIPSEFGIWHIDRTKYVKVRVFESHIYVDIRQYYESLDGKLMPSKCGISLTQYEWEKLVKIVPSISGTIFNYTYFENLD